MNHDANPTSPADPAPNEPRRPPRHGSEDNTYGSHASSAAEQQRGGASRARRSRRTSRLSRKAKEGLTKKLNLLLHLLASLDTVICAELCLLYYMDCSFFRLMIRWAPQWLYLSPNAEHLSAIIPNYPLGAILGPNLVCVLLHLITALPHAGEAARGYMHGGIFVDFVGQRPPSSKLTLLALDLVVLGLQCFMLTANFERDRINKVIKPPSRNASAEEAGTTVQSAPTEQDYDAEERGVFRDAPMTGDVDDIELQPLASGARSDPAGGNDTLRERRSSRNRSYEDLLDVFVSGNAVLADFHVRSALRSAWNNSGTTPEGAAAFAVQNIGYNATLAALAAQRQARMAGAQA